jgi:hypothetical protein
MAVGGLTEEQRQEQARWRATIARWRTSPFLFVLQALFKLEEHEWRPWQPGSPHPLSPHFRGEPPNGPELWQGNFLKDVAEAITTGRRRFTVRAGHGVGKSTVEAWLILWFVLFHRNCKVPVTANSQDQLRDVVWAEVARWHRELPEFLRNSVEISAEKIFVKVDPEGSFAVARTARPEKPEALQGFHADVLAFFIEEASGIEDVIVETAGGALSGSNSWVFMFANPTRTSGYFFRSHNEMSAEWRCYHVPCSHSSRADPDFERQIIKEWGEGSVQHRVRALGEFPLTEDDGVMSIGLLRAAVGREVMIADSAIIWGLDVARFGDDTTCLAKRRGPVLLEPTQEWRKIDLMQTTGRVVHEYRNTPIEWRPSHICVDVIGLGAGVVDRLREQGLPARGINVAEAPSTNATRYMRLRDELWFKGREWFQTLAVTIPDDKELIAELVGPKYKMESSGKLKVESKDDMKKRGVKSPNRADAFLLTFAVSDLVVERHRPVADMEYDPFNPSAQAFEREIRQVRSQGYDWTPY